MNEKNNILRLLLQNWVVASYSWAVICFLSFKSVGLVMKQGVIFCVMKGSRLRLTQGSYDIWFPLSHEK